MLGGEIVGGQIPARGGIEGDGLVVRGHGDSEVREGWFACFPPSGDSVLDCVPEWDLAALADEPSTAGVPFEGDVRLVGLDQEVLGEIVLVRAARVLAPIGP